MLTDYTRNSKNDPYNPAHPLLGGSDAALFALLPSPLLGEDEDAPLREPSPCQRVIANLSGYLDGELTPQQEQVIARHLEVCPECAQVWDSIRVTDRYLQREWLDSEPLPSSLERKFAIDSIMDALPAEPAQIVSVARKRVHARARWMRFSTGLAGLLAFVSLIWSTYKIGYANGRKNALNALRTAPGGQPNFPRTSHNSVSLLPAMFASNSSSTSAFTLTPTAFYLTHPPHQQRLRYRP